MFEEGVKCINAIHEKHSMEEIKPVVKVSLPFKVQQDFYDPYKPDGKGYSLISYPHRKDRNVFVYMYHVNLRDASVFRTKATTQYTHLEVDNSEEEDDDDDEMAGDGA